MNDDAELLRRYVDEHSNDAFSDLVQRHVGVVYATALRRVGGDAHLAEDVAQSVFVDLARKAKSLRHHHSIAGWLYRSTQYASAAVVRRESRRKRREHEVHLMETPVPTENAPVDWTRIQPVLDDAMNQLGRADREAVILRFFQQRSFAEIGSALRLSDEAARKRVDRALEKLRCVLERAGIVSTAAALGLALASAGTGLMPAGLGARLTTHALHHTGLTSSSSLLSSLTNAALPAAAVLALGGWVVGRQHLLNAELRGELAALEHRPHISVPGERTAAQSSAPQTDALRDIQSEISMLRTALAQSVPTSPIRKTVALTVTPQGTIKWGGEGVSLHDFIERLKLLPETSDGDESAVVIQAMGAGFGELAYVVDEVRKAQIKHVTVEADAVPNPKLGHSWF